MQPVQGHAGAPDLLVHFSAVTAPSFWCSASSFPQLSSCFLPCLPFALRFPLWGPARSLLLVAAPAVETPPSLPPSQLPPHPPGRVNNCVPDWPSIQLAIAAVMPLQARSAARLGSKQPACAAQAVPKTHLRMPRRPLLTTLRACMHAHKCIVSSVWAHAGGTVHPSRLTHPKCSRTASAATEPASKVKLRFTRSLRLSKEGTSMRSVAVEGISRAGHAEPAAIA
jgi:hypothetical protein